MTDSSGCEWIESILQKNEFERNMASKGYAVLPSILSEAQVKQLIASVDTRAELERNEKTEWFSHGNQRIFNLVNKGCEFLALIDHPIALELVERCIGPEALLSSLTANIALPGNKPQSLHADQGHLPEPWLRAEAVNLVWVLDDFTVENGSTRIVPGSHVIGVAPRACDVPTIPVIADSGSLVCLDGRVWHGTGHNSSSGGIRRALFGFYSRPYLRQQENFARSLDATVRRSLTAERRRLLGFDIWLGLGAVNGLPTEWMGGRERIGPTNADGAFPLKEQ